MNIKSIRSLQILTIVVQLLAVVVTIAMTIMQQNVKQIYSADTDVIAHQAIPVGALIHMIPLLCIYIAGFVIMNGRQLYATRMKAVVSVVVACIVQVMTQYTTWINYIFASQGVVALASYTSLNNVVTQVTVPLIWSGFTMFCKPPSCKSTSLTAV